MSSVKTVLFKLVLAKALVAAGVYAYVRYVLKDDITTDFSFGDAADEVLSEKKDVNVSSEVSSSREEKSEKPTVKKAVKKVAAKKTVDPNEVKVPAKAKRVVKKPVKKETPKD